MIPFHLPLNVPPEVSSETVMESAVRLGRHHGACLVASVPARRSFGRGTRFKHRDKADIQVERFEREVLARLVKHLRRYASSLSLDLRLVFKEAETMSATTKLAELARVYDVTILENME